MSLRWDITSVQDFESLKVEDSENPSRKVISGLTKTIIWLTIPVGFGEITDKNADEFFIRASIIEKCFGAFRVDPEGKDVPVTHHDIVRHIGLTTNVSRMSFPAWRKTIMERLEREARETLRNSKESTACLPPSPNSSEPTPSTTKTESPSPLSMSTKGTRNGASEEL